MIYVNVNVLGFMAGMSESVPESVPSCAVTHYCTLWTLYMRTDPTLELIER